MKKCPYCGNHMKDDDSFCTNCGKEYIVKNVCSYCGTPLNQDDEFCTNCGKSVSRRSGYYSTARKAESPHMAVSNKKSSNSKTVASIILSLFFIILIGGGLWFWKSEGNTDFPNDAKTHYIEILNNFDSEMVWNDLGSYFLYDITGDNISELCIYAEKKGSESDTNFYIYTYTRGQVVSLYEDSFEPSRTSFGKGKDRLIITTGGMGWEKMFSFIYKEGEIIINDVYSFAEPLGEERVEYGEEPELEEVQLYSISDKTPLQ